MSKIEFNKAYLDGSEIEYIRDALSRGEISGDGYYTKKVSSLLEKKFKAEKVLMTTSGSHALEMAAELVNMQEGDEVIMPSFTFSSTANAVLKAGGKPVFAEIKKDTFNLDPADFKEKITKKTKAVIPVHYAGISCEMEKIKEIAAAENIYIIEDAAQAVNSFYYGKAAGTIGDFGCYSFHGSKNFVSGEGGALLINKNNKSLIEKAEIIREKGTNRSKFMRGEIEKYKWVGTGSSYLPSDILMALLFAQLQKIKEITDKRKKIFDFYNKHLKEFLKNDFLDLIPAVPDNRKSNYHIYYLKFKNKKIRDLVLDKLKNEGIEAAFHFQPLHSSPMGKRLSYHPDDLKLSIEAAETILRLPIYPGLKRDEQKHIIFKLKQIFDELKNAGV